MRWFGLFLLLAVTVATAAVHQSWIRIPPNWLPWREVVLDEPPSWLARLQINGLAADDDTCIAALDASKLDYLRLDDRPLKEGCGLSAGVMIEKSHVAYSQTFQSTCALTAALYWYEQSLDELAVIHLGTPLRRIEHFGTYACRNINAAQTGRRSQHATANAIDIAGFRFADGSSVSVLRDWGRDTSQGRFVAAAHAQACRFFNVVLGPRYNRLHANHFHLDLGRARICR